jgi:hypothetical protein
MKTFAASPLAASIAVSFLLMPAGSSMILAQGVENPTALPNQVPTQPGQTKLLQKQRDSAAPRGAQDSSNVRARRKPNAAATAPDTSYHTITNTPPSSRTTTNRVNVNDRANTNSTTSRGAAPSAVAPSGTNGEPQQQGLSVQNPSGKTNLPESMQIQQNTVRALPPRQELITKGGSSAPPNAVNSSIEQNRLDSSAPSRQRLQIDDLSARQAQQPNAPFGTPPTNPSPSGTLSGNGSSTGTSGGAVSGPAGTAGAMGVSPATPGAASGASPSTSSHSSGGSSSGGSH